MPATAQVRIAADATQFSRTMDKVNRTFEKTKTNAEKFKAVGSIFQKFAGGLGSIGSIGGLTAAVNSYSKFQKDVAEVYTLLPNANKAFFQKLQTDALAFSERFGMNTENVTKGMYQAISAGISPDDLTDDGEFLDVAAKAAVAGVTDLRTAVDSLTNVVNSYGKGVYDMQQVSDMMFKAVSMSKTTFREMSDYLYQVLPTAGSLKLRLDDLLGSISALAAQGTLTRVATTQIRQMLIEMGRAGDKANLAFIEASGGVPLQKFIRDGGRMTEIIDLMGRVARKRGTDIRNLFGSVEAGNAAISLYNSLSFANMTKALDEDSGAASGETSKAYQKIFNTISFQWDRFTAKFYNSFKRFGNILEPVIVDVVQFMHKQLTEALGAIDFEGFRGKFARFWDRLKTLIKDGRLGELIVEGVEAGIASLLLLFNDMKASFLNTLVDINVMISPFLKVMSTMFSSIWDGFKTVGGSVTDFILEKFKSLLASIFGFFQSLADKINQMTDPSAFEADKKRATKLYIEDAGGEEEAYKKAVKLVPLNDLYDAKLKEMQTFTGSARTDTGKIGNVRDLVKGVRDSILGLKQYISGREAMGEYERSPEFQDLIKNLQAYQSGGKEGPVDLQQIFKVGDALEKLIPYGFGSDESKNAYRYIKRLKYTFYNLAANAEGIDMDALKAKDSFKKFKNKVKGYIDAYSAVGSGTAKLGLEEIINKPLEKTQTTYNNEMAQLKKDLEKQRDQFLNLLSGGRDIYAGKPDSGSVDLSDPSAKKEDFNYFTRFSSVVADSLQKIGGGGYTSVTAMSPEEKVVNATEKNTEATNRLSDTFIETINKLNDVGLGKGAFDQLNSLSDSLGNTDIYTPNDNRIIPYTSWKRDIERLSKLNIGDTGSAEGYLQSKSAEFGAFSTFLSTKTKESERVTDAINLLVDRLDEIGGKSDPINIAVK